MYPTSIALRGLHLTYVLRNVLQGLRITKTQKLFFPDDIFVHLNKAAMLSQWFGFHNYLKKYFNWMYFGNCLHQHLMR